MKKKKSILKFVRIVLIFNILINCSYAQELNQIDIYDYNVVNRVFKEEISKLLNNYSNKKNISADVFDTSNPILKSFIDHTTHRSNDNILATQYFNKITVNGNNTPFCFIFYDGKQNIFKSYENTKIFSREEALKYLIWHEMGHCFAFHEQHIKTGRYDEIIADIFAISLSLNNNNPELALKIIKQIKSIKSEDIHSNGEQLQLFLDYITKNKIFESHKTINEILSIIYNYMAKI